MCERPPRSLRSRLPLTRGRLNVYNVRALFSPSVRGKAAEGGRGPLTHHLQLELGNPLRGSNKDAALAATPLSLLSPPQPFPRVILS